MKDLITIYHIPGQKFGATTRPNKRKVENLKHYKNKGLVVEVIEIYTGYIDIDEATIWEDALNDSYGYPKGTPYNQMYLRHKGRKDSKETTAKRKIANSPDNHSYLKGKAHPMYGKSPSQQTRDKIGAGNRGKKRSQQTRDKLSAARRGKDSPHCKPVLINGKHFDLLEEAFAYVGRSRGYVIRRLDDPTNLDFTYLPR